MLPSKTQSIYAQAMMLEMILHFLRDNAELNEFSDIDLISDMDKARVCLKSALQRMEMLLVKARESKSVCY